MVSLPLFVIILLTWSTIQGIGLPQFRSLFTLPSVYSTEIPSNPGRNKHQQPFASTSIWNMPIGSQAQYQAANLQPAKFISADLDRYLVIAEPDPIVPWYRPGSWSHRSSGTTLLGYLRIPHTLVVPDATPTYRPNNAAALLQPNGRTLVQLNALTRPAIGGPVYGYRATGYPRIVEDIYGTGITGGHGGSGLSSIGGTIRRGELLPDRGPIPHALKMNVYAHRYLYHQQPGYRWPAVKADAYAFDPNSSRRYGGTNPALVMGTLLAIPPQAKRTDLNLKTAPAQKLFAALQDYGAYITDDTAWNAYAIAIEAGVEEEFAEAYGYGFKGNSGDFYEDVNRLIQALQIVDNNTAETIGGGGEPRQPLAPPIGN